MARFYADEVDHYGGQGGAGYFSLKNDKDTAQVRFLYDRVEDIVGDSVHEVQIDGKKRYVNCLRAYNEPIDNCPFCKARQFQTAKLFVPLYNLDADKVQVWERGKKFFSKISSTLARYSNESTPIVSQVYEIERLGAKGDTQTSYEIYPVGQPDNTNVDDFEQPQILGSVILDKSPSEMEYYLDNGVFPSSDNEPIRRRDTQSQGRREEPTRRDTERRVPNRRDSF